MYVNNLINDIQVYFGPLWWVFYSVGKDGYKFKSRSASGHPPPHFQIFTGNFTLFWGAICALCIGYTLFALYKMHKTV